MLPKLSPHHGECVSDGQGSCVVFRYLADRDEGLAKMEGKKFLPGRIVSDFGKHILLDSSLLRLTIGFLSGIVVHLSMIPDEFRKALDLARTEHIPLHEAEMRSFGLRHA